MAGRQHRLLSWVGLILVSVEALYLLLAVSANSSQFEGHPELPGIRLPHDELGMTEGCREALKVGAGARKLLEVEYDAMSMSMKSRRAHYLDRRRSRINIFAKALGRDRSRVQSIQRRIGMELGASIQATSPSPAEFSPLPMATPPSVTYNFESTVESGVSLGSGEYLMDVYIGTPRRHFSLIIDTGSDLTWVQCTPCKDCYHQEGPMFDPCASSSYYPIACSDSKCGLVSHVDDQACTPQNPDGCRYFYNYGDKSNTTGDLAMETFTLKGSDGKPLLIGNVTFGCGHANEGLFRGAGGLLGLGKGALSFPSQLGEIYGRKFSYCLVDRENDLSVSSILTFGEDKRLSTHPDLQYTSFASNTSTKTFYYVEIEKVMVGGEDVPIPSSVWEIDTEGSGGTIVDSGTTLTYFNELAYEAISKAFEARMPYPRAQAEHLSLCYNLTGVSDLQQLPDFAIRFKDGAVMKLPKSNYFLNLYPESHISCLAIMRTPSSTMSILGNLLQQNVHMMYDLQRSRLGFAPMICSSLTS